MRIYKNCPYLEIYYLSTSYLCSDQEERKISVCKKTQ